MEKHLLILFGKAGAGKNYVAKILERDFGYYFYDGDIDLSYEMITAIEKRLEFSDEMRTKYFNVIEKRIRELLVKKNRIVVAQGLFRNKNRNELNSQFPFAKFICIAADKSILETRVQRRNNIVTLEYARKINEFFEEPDFECYRIINNNGEQDVVNQISKIIKDV